MGNAEGLRAQRRVDEAPSLAVGLRPLGPREAMAHTRRFTTGADVVGPECRAVDAEQASHAYTDPSVVRNHVGQVLQGTRRVQLRTPDRDSDGRDIRMPLQDQHCSTATKLNDRTMLQVHFDTLTPLRCASGSVAYGATPRWRTHGRLDSTGRSIRARRRVVKSRLAAGHFADQQLSRGRIGDAVRCSSLRHAPTAGGDFLSHLQSTNIRESRILMAAGSVECLEGTGELEPSRHSNSVRESTSNPFSLTASVP